MRASGPCRRPCRAGAGGEGVGGEVDAHGQQADGEAGRDDGPGVEEGAGGVLADHQGPVGGRGPGAELEETARVVARTGLLIGGSAGGVVYEALHRLPSLPPDTTMVALVNDGGEKYMDTVFDDDRMHRRNLIDPAVEREIDETLTKLRTK